MADTKLNPFVRLPQSPTTIAEADDLSLKQANKFQQNYPDDFAMNFHIDLKDNFVGCVLSDKYYAAAKVPYPTLTQKVGLHLNDIIADAVKPYDDKIKQLETKISEMEKTMNEEISKKFDDLQESLSAIPNISTAVTDSINLAKSEIIEAVGASSIAEEDRLLILKISQDVIGLTENYNSSTTKEDIIEAFNIAIASAVTDIKDNSSGEVETASLAITEDQINSISSKIIADQKGDFSSIAQSIEIVYAAIMDHLSAEQGSVVTEEMVQEPNPDNFEMP